MPNVRVATIDKASKEFRPIIADFPIDGKLLYGLFASGEIEDSDNPLFYATR